MSDKPQRADKPQRLIPARPDVDESRSYMPHVPWPLVGLAVLAVAVVIAGYQWKERRKADQLRAMIVHVHDSELGEARSAYAAMRDKLEKLVLSAAKASTDTQVDPRLNIPGLRSGQGLYLRLALGDAGSERSIVKGAKVMTPDLIATCMGLAPLSVRGLYEKGEFLTDKWLEDTKKLQNVMQLRVQDEVLSRHLRADLPSVLGLLRADWLLLVLQEGVNRKLSPVRVFLWDLKRETLLLRARVQAQGVLLTTRILSKDAPYSPALAEQGKESGGAVDCSIASQLKALSR